VHSVHEAAAPGLSGEEGSGEEATDAARLRRLRWRVRRGLLENDLILSAFLDARAGRLSHDELRGLDWLLDLPDQELLDLMLGRKEAQLPEADDHVRRVLACLHATRLPGQESALPSQGHQSP